MFRRGRYGWNRRRRRGGWFRRLEQKSVRNEWRVGESREPLVSESPVKAIFGAVRDEPKSPASDGALSRRRALVPGASAVAGVVPRPPEPGASRNALHFPHVGGGRLRELVRGAAVPNQTSAISGCPHGDELRGFRYKESSEHAEERIDFRRRRYRTAHDCSRYLTPVTRSTKLRF